MLLFAGNETGGSAQAEACTSPVLWAGLPDGPYSFSVAATDRLGNAGPPASAAFLVDTTPPDIGNVASPAATRASSIAVSFAVTDTGSGVNSTSCRCPRCDPSRQSVPFG